jgi:hypothetical protein
MERLAFFLAPLAWTLDEGLSYVLVKPVCGGGYPAPVLLIVSLVAFAISGTGAWLGWTSLIRLQHAHGDGGTAIDRSYFMAMLALGFNVLIALLVLNAAIPRLVLSPCE